MVGMAETLAGKLLVATPKLVDPNFHRTVVLLLSHDEAGAFGVVLNRPLELAVAEVLPGWQRLAREPAVVFLGGPVETKRALALARCGAAVPAEGWTRLSGEIGLVDLTLPPVGPGDGIADLRVFTGYAGWGEGQLEGEVAEDDWFVVEARPADAFSKTPESLWREVLLRQPGQVAMYAFFPTDPFAN